MFDAIREAIANIDVDRRLLIGIPIAVALLLLLIGFGTGRATTGGTDGVGTEGIDDNGSALSASDGDPLTGDAAPGSTITGDASAVLPPTSDTPEEGAPIYGSDDDRVEFIAVLVEIGVVNGTEESLLATADHVCYNLERLQAQERSPAFAVRVVWNESLLELESEDLAAFSAVFDVAPHYLCPESVEYGTEVAYWMGY